jgi:DNA-binding HxlR family transcriptional regulator/putative sterol carrier protein
MQQERGTLHIMKSRGYNQLCGLAYAFDVIGERWTGLVLRELFAGPRRFKDLMDGLPGISTNLLAERLKMLEERGIIQRRVLPPPAASTVYELTAVGRALEPTMIELGRWGSQFLPPTPDDVTVLRIGSYALTFKTFFRAEDAQEMNETYELRVGTEIMQIHIENGTIAVDQGQPRKADAVFHGDVMTVLGLIQGAMSPDDAIAHGLVRVEGDPGALGRLIALCGMADMETDDVPAAAA